MLGHWHNSCIPMQTRAPPVVSPRIHHYRATRRVITMEFVEGIKVTDTDALRSSGIDA